MGKANQGIRNELREKDIPHWQLAQTLGVHETTLVRWLRSPLSPENTARIRIAINEIMELREGGTKAKKRRFLLISVTELAEDE